MTFASGDLAGLVCAIIVALATNSLSTRVLMISTLTGFRWWIYDSHKTAMGMGTTGGN